MKRQIIIAIETTHLGEDLNIGFMVAPRSPSSVLEKQAGLQTAVRTGAYRDWSGANRRKFVDKVLSNGNIVDFRIFEGVFNGKTKAGNGITLEQ